MIEKQNTFLELKEIKVSISSKNKTLFPLQGVSLSIPHNSNIALVGESGSGKSLTASAIIGMLPSNAKILEGKGMSAKVINMHTIKPIDEKLIDELSKDSKLLVTVEEHSVIGGLGSSVAEIKSTISNSPPQLMIGLPDRFDIVGEYNYL